MPEEAALRSVNANANASVDDGFSVALPPGLGGAWIRFLSHMGAIGVLCWLVVSELPKMRSESAAQYMAFIGALDKHGGIIRDLVHEVQELRRDRVTGHPPASKNPPQ